MKRIKLNLLALALLAGIGSGFAKAGPWEACNVDTREELGLLCPPGTPICCRFFTFTWLTDTNEFFPAGTLYRGYYTPL